MRYYTYLWLRDDGTPYYVGKGTWRRAHRRGAPPEHRILMQEHPSESDAFAVEVFFIVYYGRKDNGTGILRNRTDGGEGVSGQLALLERNAKCKGVPLSPEHRAKMSAAKQGKPPNNLGTTRSEESKARTSETLRHWWKLRNVTHCKRGHERTPDNVYSTGGSCRQCRKERWENSRG